MNVPDEKVNSILQFYLNDMELEDKIYNALADEEVEQV